MAPTAEPKTLADAPFGPEEINTEQLEHVDSALKTLSSPAGDDPQAPVPLLQLAPATTSPAGEPPPYTAPGDDRRTQALAPAAPALPVGNQPVGQRPEVVIHHVHEGMSRAAETAAIHKVLVVGTAPIQIVGKNDQRRRLTIQNNGSSTISVGMDESVTFEGPNSFDIAGGASMDFHHRDWMWAISGGSAGPLQIVDTINELSPTQIGTLAPNTLNVRTQP